MRCCGHVPHCNMTVSHPSFINATDATRILSHAAAPMCHEGIALLQLPNGVAFHILGLLSLRDCAAVAASCSALAQAVQGVLCIKTAVALQDDTLLDKRQTHTHAARLFRFLAKQCPRLSRLSCLFASDQLYGGQLLATSLQTLAANCPALTHLTLLNVDVTDALAGVAQHCPLLVHLGLGRTENNAFGNFVGDEGIGAVVRACPRLESLALFRCYSCGDASLLECVRSRRSIRSLTLHDCPQITPSGLTAFFEGSRHLTSLDVLVADGGPGGSCLTFGSLFALAANCGELGRLRVSEELLRTSVLEDGALALVPRGCHKLRELELVQVEAGDALLAALAGHCTGLEVLRLEQTYAGDAGVALVARRCKKLRELRVAGCSPHCWMLPAELMFEGISVAGAHGISRHATALTSLELSGLVPRAHMPHDSNASVTNSSRDSSNMGSSSNSDRAGSDGSSCEHGACACSGSSCSCSAAGCQSSCGSPLPLLEPQLCGQLRQLSLDWLKFDGPVLQRSIEAVLVHCGHLESLSMAGFQGNADQALQQLACAGAPLCRLNLQHTGVTDAGLATVVRAFPRLHTLTLSYCRRVTDGGVTCLAAARQLHTLDLYNAPSVSEGAIHYVARHHASLRKVYIGLHTGMLCKSPQPSSTGWRLQEVGSDSGNPGLQLLRKNPGSDSAFERRSLQHVMQQ